MGGTVRARVKGSVLELSERVDLPEGAEVTVTIIEAPSGRDREAFRRAAGAWKETVDAEALIRTSMRIVSSPAALNPAYDPALPCGYRLGHRLRPWAASVANLHF